MAGTRLRFDGVVIDEGAQQLVVDGRAVGCPAPAIRLLALLASAPREVHTRARLTAAVWPDATPVADDALTQLAFRLRATLGRYGPAIVTVRGVGFRLDADVSAEREAVPPTKAAAPEVLPPVVVPPVAATSKPRPALVVTAVIALIAAIAIAAILLLR